MTRSVRSAGDGLFGSACTLAYLAVVDDLYAAILMCLDPRLEGKTDFLENQLVSLKGEELCSHAVGF
eukprot:755525-Hanusia_phi.AAC.5